MKYRTTELHKVLNIYFSVVSVISTVKIVELYRFAPPSIRCSI